MLELKDITKIYETKDLRVEALKGINIKFRKNEFVSILGPSGCGKTTFLNIVGGLDNYTSGDLIINNKSTKNFTDRDWDAYRNHTIGFVFQSYNLIPHQTVLENVELALTLSGVSKEERKNRAIIALEKVGLKDKLKSKPNQLSGGQMQRVAIARALVNDPDVVLADEPTGALDSKTSVQVMDLLREIAKEKLVIMVTHNPSLAEQYSTRIIKFLDGELVDDSNPSKEQNDVKAVPVEEGKGSSTSKKARKKPVFKKTSMSFFTALGLSFKNLLTKKARTLLVAFAGSIGIFGIALILALSSGFQSYINKTQEDTLSNYPITINRTNADMMAMAMKLFSPREESASGTDAIYAEDTMSGMFEEASKQMTKTNDLEAFSAYIEEHKKELGDSLSAIQYTYELSLSESKGSMSSMMGGGESEATTLAQVKLPDGREIKPESSALFDLILTYSVLYLENEFPFNVVVNADNNFEITIDPSNTTAKKSADEGKQFIIVYMQMSSIDVATKVTTSPEWKATLSVNDFITIIYNAMGINISTYAKMDLDLFNEMIDNPTLLKSQYELLGSSSKWATSKNEVMLVLNQDYKLDDYVLYTLGLISDDQMREHLKSIFTDNKTQIKLDFNDVIGKEMKVILNTDYYMDVDGVLTDIRTLQETNPELYNQKMNLLLTDDNYGTKLQIVGVVRLKDDASAGSLSTGLCYTNDLTMHMLNKYNSSQAVTSGKVGAVSLAPKSISFYASDFEAKEKIEKFIDNYNASVDDSKKIEYTDYIGLMMGAVSTIISAISYVLIAFVSVSLIVSSIMIGIITYISVLERIKEIGILRDVGASKKDIKRVFTAETLIIGLIAGLMGIILAVLLTIPINIIIKNLAGIAGVAKLPALGAVILVAISCLLTFIAGLIPAKIASKKDPVIALRSE